jgi:hypothetical protein
MAEVLSTPRNEFPQFPAGLSLLPLLTPESVRELLKTRRELLVQRLAERILLSAAPASPLPRATMLETAYLHAVTEAEIRWLDNVLTGLEDGSICGAPENCTKLTPCSTAESGLTLKLSNGRKFVKPSE